MKAMRIRSKVQLRSSWRQSLQPLGFPLFYPATVGFRIIGEHRRKPGDGADPDLFDLLASGQPKSNFSAEQLADQVATIVVAGHETTAAALFWSLYPMAPAPQEQDAVAAEAASVDLVLESAADAVPQLFRTKAVVTMPSPYIRRHL